MNAIADTRLLVRLALTTLWMTIAPWSPVSECLAGASNPSTPAANASTSSTIKYSKGLLWRIEGEAVKPSYLFGTIHLNDPRVTLLPAPVQQAFDQSSSFTMELITDGDGVIAIAEAMFFNDGRTLPTVIGSDLYQQTREALIQNGLPTDDLERKKPWSIMVMLSMPRQTAALPLDFLLQFNAVRQGKPVYGLESAQEQISIFDDIPMNDQIALLESTLQMHKQTEAYIESLVQAYLQRDLTAIMTLMADFVPDQGKSAFDAFMERLLPHRNGLMAERMLPRLKEGNAFIAVGAGHLGGEQGLLHLLEGKGYRLTAIY